MGDRARVFFHNPVNREIGPGVYLHWDGYRMRELLAEAKQRMIGREGDTGYCSARFIGICHEKIPGNLSLGTEIQAPEGNTYRDKLKSLRAKDGRFGYRWSPGDAGVFLVNCSTWSVEVFGGYGFSDFDASPHCPRVELPYEVWVEMSREEAKK